MFLSSTARVYYIESHCWYKKLDAGDQGKSLSVYFPEGKWYDWYTRQVVSENGKETKTLDTPKDIILVCS